MQNARYLGQSVPPLLHVEKETTSLIHPTVSSMQPYHHVINVFPSAVILLVLHPFKYFNAVLKRTSVCYLLQQ